MLTNIRRDHPLSGSVMKQHNTPPAPLTIFVRVSRKDLSRKCSASQMQLEFTTIFLYTNNQEYKRSSLVRSCHETAQHTFCSSHYLVRFSVEETFIANAQLAGCNWNLPWYFCTQITKNTRDHLLSGSHMKQQNKRPAPLTILVRVSVRNLSRKCSASWMQLEFTMIFLYYTDNQEYRRRSPLFRFYHETAQSTPLILSIFWLVFYKEFFFLKACQAGCKWKSAKSPCFICSWINQE
jgi:hypothetical protein